MIHTLRIKAITHRAPYLSLPCCWHIFLKYFTYLPKLIMFINKLLRTLPWFHCFSYTNCEDLMMRYGNHMASLQIKKVIKKNMSYQVDIKMVSWNSHRGCSDFHYWLKNERIKTTNRKQRKKKKANYCFQQYN